ncbi:hypothetical protein [Micromonospora zamorensis]|uniref:hypothetical protein n=1 Tax=Micromonospora zamorensis TaxID=709883 RepID=UPI00352B74F3
MAQRLVTALALAPVPSLLIADEPTTGLDRPLVDHTLDLLRWTVDAAASAGSHQQWDPADRQAGGDWAVSARSTGALRRRKIRHDDVVEDRLYDVTKDERRAAVKAFRQLSSEERREAIRRAGRGQPHPNPAVAGIVEQWSRAVLRRAWWNKLPGWTQPAACLAVIVFGSWLGAGVVVIPGGIVALTIGLIDWNGRRTARMVMNVARPEGSTERVLSV